MSEYKEYVTDEILIKEISNTIIEIENSEEEK